MATSGWRGRSCSLGIADAVTVLARSAADADAAATLVANAVDCAHPAISRKPASLLHDDTDLGDLAVTVAVGPLPGALVAEALDRGVAVRRSHARCRPDLCREPRPARPEPRGPARAAVRSLTRHEPPSWEKPMLDQNPPGAERARVSRRRRPGRRAERATRSRSARSTATRAFRASRCPTSRAGSSRSRRSTRPAACSAAARSR